MTTILTAAIYFAAALTIWLVIGWWADVLTDIEEMAQAMEDSIDDE